MKPKIQYAGILTGFLLSGCLDAMSPRDQAYQLWEELCPEHAAEGYNLTLENVDQHSSQTRELAKSGNPDALKCIILELEAWIVPYSEKEVQQQIRWAGEPFILPTKSARIELFRARYMLYHLTGEGREALETLASGMTKDEIDSALYFHVYDEPIQIPRQNNSCGSLSRSDPKYWLIELGTGEHTPVDCPEWDEIENR